MNIFADPIANGLYFTLVAATAAIPLLLIVLVVDLTLGRRLAPAYRSLLWTLVAVRLLVPIALPNTLGVPNLWWAAVEEGSPHEAPSVKRTTQPNAESPPVIPATSVMGITGADPSMPLPRAEASPTPRVVKDRSLDWEDFIALGILSLWPIGAFTLLGRAVIGSVRFTSRLRRIPAVSDPVVIDLLAEVCRTMQISRAPRVKYVPGLSAPALFGSIKPTLCLPETEQSLSRDELRMVFIHELAHLVRFDGYVAWVLVVVQSIHWFNPLAWFVTRQVAHTRELACDEAVRRFTATSEHRTYGDLIVRFASARPSVNLGLVGLWFARPIRRLKSRVEACSAERTRRWRLPRPLALVLVALVACVGLSDRAPSRTIETSTTLPVPHIVSPEVVAAAKMAVAQTLDPRPAGSEVIEVRDYDVSHTLAKLLAADPEADPLHWLLTHIRPDGEEFPKPALVATNREAGKITLRMSRNEHTGFAEVLAGIDRSGPWKIDVEVRFFRVTDFEMFGDVDWEKAFYTTPISDPRQEEWPQADEDLAGEAVISMASTSASHGAFTSALIDEDQMRRAVQNAHQGRRSRILHAPRVTLFNGSGGMMRDEACAPYLTGLARSSDPERQSLEPVVSVLSEGSRLEFRGDVVDAGTLELSCRAIFSEIDSVHEGRIPGTQHVLQVPKVNQVVFQARRCRFSPGQTLIVPSIARLQDGGQPVESLCVALTPRWSPATAPRHDAPTEPTTYIDETGGSL